MFCHIWSVSATKCRAIFGLLGKFVQHLDPIEFGEPPGPQTTTKIMRRMTKSHIRPFLIFYLYCIRRFGIFADGYDWILCPQQVLTQRPVLSTVLGTVCICHFQPLAARDHWLRKWTSTLSFLNGPKPTEYHLPWPPGLLFHTRSRQQSAKGGISLLKNNHLEASERGAWCLAGPTDLKEEISIDLGGAIMAIGMTNHCVTENSRVEKTMLCGQLILKNLQL